MWRGQGRDSESLPSNVQKGYGGGNNNYGSSSTKDDGAMDKKMMLVVFISLVLDLLAFTMILPLLPALLDYYGQTDKDGLYTVLKNSVHGFRSLVGAPDTPRWNSVLFGGLIGSLFSWLQFLASPIIGATSDVYGRKPVLLLSMFGIAVSYALWAVSRSFTIFVIARVVGGISKGNISLSTAIVTDIAPPQKRGKGMALIGVAFSVGFIVGPLIGAFFSRQARSQENMFFVAPALFALFLAVADIVFLLVFFKETLPAEKRAPSLGRGVSEAKDFISPVALFKFKAVTGTSSSDLKSMQNIGMAYFLYLFLYSGLEFTLTFLTHNRFNYDSLQQGKMFFVMGTVMVLVQGGFVRRLKPGNEMKVASLGILLVIPSFVIIGLAYQQWVLYLGLLLYSFASATVVPCLTTVVSSYGTVEQKGTVLGIFRSLGALARAIGPFAACTVYWCFGPVVCYTLGAISLMLPLQMLRKLRASHID